MTLASLAGSNPAAERNRNIDSFRGQSFNMRYFMIKSDYYKCYQANLKLLEIQIDQVKRMVQTTIGKNMYECTHKNNASIISKNEKEIKAGTRLFSFLICSWFEVRLMKMLYEDSSAAFSDSEIKQIRSLNTAIEQWRTSFLIAICRSYGFTYNKNQDYNSLFTPNSKELLNFQQVNQLFEEISDAITIRNRLAHGQWDIQFNSRNTQILTPGFLNTYDNIQKLDLLKQCFNHIAELINMYVTYKDKQNPNFDKNVNSLVQKINDKKLKINNMDFQKYQQQLGRKYQKNVLRQTMTNQ